MSLNKGKSEESDKKRIVENIIKFVENKEDGIDFDPVMFVDIMPETMKKRWQQKARATFYDFLLNEKDMSLLLFVGDVRRYYKKIEEESKKREMQRAVLRFDMMRENTRNFFKSLPSDLDRNS